MYTRVHMYMYTCVHVCMCACLHMYMCACVHMISNKHSQIIHIPTLIVVICETVSLAVANGRAHILSVHYSSDRGSGSVGPDTSIKVFIASSNRELSSYWSRPAYGHTHTFINTCIQLYHTVQNGRVPGIDGGRRTKGDSQRGDWR